MENSRFKKLKSFLQDNPNDAFLMFALAKEYEKMGEIHKAIDQYNQLLNIDPDYVGAYLHLGNLYLILKNESNAIKTFNDGIAVAKKIKDFHSLSELNSAKINIGID